MFADSSYQFIMLSISAGLLSLVGSVGIFVSLIVQRRVQRLQEILEQLVDVTYEEEKNLTSQIYRLIEKYQMHYLLPDAPSKVIINYVDMTLLVVVGIWSLLLSLSYSGIWRWQASLYLFPMLVILVILYLFRRLLQNAINPLDNRLFNAILPPPSKLRSVSFLSGYVNVSVRALLRQVRLTLVVRKIPCQNGELQGEVVLKEELSFDDFFYFLCLHLQQEVLFVSFGEVNFQFQNDHLTRKPVPIQRNINIPLGKLKNWSLLPKEFAAELLIFPAGQKHPVHYTYFLENNGTYLAPVKEARATENQDMIYSWEPGKINILENHSNIPGLQNYLEQFYLQDARWFVDMTGDQQLQLAERDCYVN